MPSSVVSGLKNAFKEYAPSEYLSATDIVTRAADDIRRRGPSVAGDAHRMPRDSYVDPHFRRNAERIQAAQNQFSHKPFVSAAPGLQALNPNPRHIMEMECPPKRRRDVGHSGPTLQAHPVRVGKAPPNVAGMAGRGIGSDQTYIEDPMYFENAERIARAVKLGLGNGFRSTKRPPGRFEAASKGGGLFDEGVYRQRSSDTPMPMPREGVDTSNRVPHHVPWNPTAQQKTRPVDAFSSFPASREPYNDKPKRTKKRFVSHVPFKAAVNSQGSLPTRSIMFRKR